jgi:exonuclease SbcC
MIPLELRIAGFLSYREPAVLDFTTFELACVSGQNGAGKSSLLDAITWALFGQARKRDDALVNLQSKAAQVSLTFEYEGNVYRVQRALPRGKSATLEFQLKNGDGWRPLTERTLRETQARIEQTLRLDYDTFVNAAFFLQGKADQFTQQTAARRKDVLGAILGLEIWESYRERTAARRKGLEDTVGGIDGRVAEIDAELSEEDQRRTRLDELETNLTRLAAARTAQESQLAHIRRLTASLEEQRRLAETLAASLARAEAALGALHGRRAEKESERLAYADLVKRARQVEAAYHGWQRSLAELARLDGVAAQFREHDEHRQPLLREIAAERARLEEEQRGLNEQDRLVTEAATTGAELETRIAGARESLAQVEQQLDELHELEARAQAARERQAELKADNERLKSEMDELKARIDRLKVASGATCPLCGQALSESHRKSTLAGLERDGKNKGDAYRSNQTETKQLEAQLAAHEKALGGLPKVDAERLAHSNSVSQLSERLEALQRQSAEWARTGARRLKDVCKQLEKESFAPETRKQLARVDKELARLGYDAAAHDAARRAETEARAAEEEYRRLESAREVSRQIEGELASLETEIGNRSSEIESLAAQQRAAAEALQAAESQAPSLELAERELLVLREQENQARAEVGAARQKVEVLGTLRARRETLAGQREELQKQVAHHRALERAFGKDGVPALLIEQALPEIEARANEMLDRLSNGQMSVRFVTQAEYKDKKREDLRETLEIQISDGAGQRDYEMYSGGEAFRVNFAIRLALSEVLAQRKGARLQTLVIDEGFGSQDLQGRQRLIEAINLVRGDFSKILVITHLDELKDAFPTRIEVEKVDGGSVIRVQ